MGQRGGEGSFHCEILHERSEQVFSNTQILKSRFLNLMALMPTNQKTCGWVLLVIKDDKLSSRGGADSLMGQKQEQNLSWKDVHYPYDSALS